MHRLKRNISAFSWVSSAKTNSLGLRCQIQTRQWEEEALIQSWSIWQSRQCKESSSREEDRQIKNDPWEKNIHSYIFLFNLVKKGKYILKWWHSWGLDICKIMGFSLILRLNKNSLILYSSFSIWDFTCICILNLFS